jgi:hypothetical protein
MSHVDDVDDDGGGLEMRPRGEQLLALCANGPGLTLEGYSSDASACAQWRPPWTFSGFAVDLEALAAQPLRSLALWRHRCRHRGRVEEICQKPVVRC